MTDDFTLGIEGTSHPILCGLCKSPITRRVEPARDGGDDDPILGCAHCDNWAEQSEVVRLVKEYVVDEGQMILNRMMRDTAKKSRIMTFKGKTASDKEHRFIVKLEG